MCGERRVRSMATTALDGSSPRVRGTVASDLLEPAGHRFIPACAGNGASALRIWWSPPVHPRVCGERASTPEPAYQDAGSSPRVRGTVGAGSNETGPDGFIPACAGNGPTCAAGARPSTVHPRVCGERSRRRLRTAAVGGSSPRVRGTGGLDRSPRDLLRFIPACAGNGFA